jgi:hypothetical protein
VTWLWPAMLAGVLSLAACGVGATGSVAPTPTPTPSAQQILQRASAVSINDAAFTFSGTVTSAGQTTNISGSGKFTKSPARFEMQISGTFSGIQISPTFIVDAATNTVYIKFGPNSLGISPDVWYKGAATGSLGSFASIGSEIAGSAGYSSLTNVTLVGTDTVNGVAVWHVRGTDKNGATDDVYVRQDNYYPVKVIVSGNGTNLTITFTSVNTGVSITLPTQTQPFPG